MTGVLIPTIGEEAWRAVPGYEGLYEVSDRGRVRSFRHKWGLRAIPRILSPGVKSNGYAQVILCRDKVQRSHTVHTLMARAFLGPPPDGQEVRHLDGVRLHNSLENLAYGTRSDNMFDAVRHGTHPSVRRRACRPS